MNHKQGIWLLKPIGFIAGLLLLLVLSSILFQPFQAMDWRKSKDLGLSKERENSLDYLVLGDSLANRAVSPMEMWKDYGYTGYNCGVGGQRLQMTYYMLKDILKTQSPKVVFFEPNALFRNYGFFFEANLMLDNELKEVLPVFQHHNNWKAPDFLAARKQPVKTNAFQFKGYTYRTIVNPYKWGNYVQRTEDAVKISAIPRYYFDLMLDLCREHNIKLVLFSTPSPVSWSYEKHNAVREFAGQREVDFIDFNLLLEEIKINWEKDTYDKGDHLNSYGAKKVTHYLGSYLSQQGILTDHRKEEGYQDWNTELERYLKKAKGV